MKENIVKYKCIKKYVPRVFLGNEVVSLTPDKIYKSVDGIIIDNRGKRKFADYLEKYGYIERLDKTVEGKYYYIVLDSDTNRYAVESCEWSGSVDDKNRLSNGNLFRSLSRAAEHADCLNRSCDANAVINEDGL